MEGVVIDQPTLAAEAPSDDFCDSILYRFANSSQDDHQHLCAAIGAMSQELRDQNLPLTPIAYFGAACSSLDRLLSQPDSPPHLIHSLATILSLVLPRLSGGLLRKKGDFVSEIAIKVLMLTSLPDGAVVAGLKCLSHLFVAGNKNSWSELSRLYVVLLGFVVDCRPKVRRQSHLSLRDVLEAFQGTPVLGPASEGITNVFERFLLLAGGSSTESSEGTRGAQEVLYVLDALKEFLPFMSMKHITTALKYFKTLMELRQPLVNKRLTDSLYVVCTHPTSQVSADVLLDLLCYLALSLSTNETNAVSMTFNTRLLSVGMTKMYSLNRQPCVTKLPVMFTALKDVLGSGHEEAILAARDAFKSLINGCVDENLIKQGVDQIINPDMDVRRAGPTIIEKMCATIESLLEYHYSTAWDMAFQVISEMFNKLGYYSSYLMKGTLKNLADMQNLPDEDFPYRKQLHECIGSALGAMGPETFLGLLPLNLEADDLSEVNVWLFPILKQYTVGARLSFFTETILAMVGTLRQRSHKLEAEGKIFSSRSVNSLVYSVWSLLPSFCNYPVDTAESFKDLQKALCNALIEQLDVRGVICSSLQILVQQNKKAKQGIDDFSDVDTSSSRLRAVPQYTQSVAENNLNVLTVSAPEILSVLSRIFMESTTDEGGLLLGTIAQLASIARKNVVRTLFRKTMQRLLAVTPKPGAVEKSKSGNSMHIDNSSSEGSLMVERARLFDLAISLLPGLDEQGIDLLFKAITPALQDTESLIQKKAYKVLSIILKNCDDFISSKLEELLALMIQVLTSCHFSAKRHRLDCLHYLIAHVSKVGTEQRVREILASFLTEILLSLKESNKKTRNRAYEVLVQIGHAYGDEENGGNRENLYQLFNMVAGGLAGDTPHMISAATKGLARLAYEFSDLVSTAFKLLPSTFLLLQRKNREIIKANLGLLKVLVAKSHADGLQAHLGSMVEGLFKWQDNTKNHFKAKVKLLLEMLVQKCGLEAVKAVMPEDHMKLLSNIRKVKERKARKLAASSVESRSHLSKATTSRLSKWNHTQIFSDFGDEGAEDSDDMSQDAVSGRQRKGSSRLKSIASLQRSRRSRRTDKSLPEDLFDDEVEDEPLDLLDRLKTRSVLRSYSQRKRKQDSDDEPEFDSEGRMIIHEGGKKKKVAPSDPDSDARSEAPSHISAGSSRNLQKRRRTSQDGWAYTGSEYGSKKAGGDVKKKDKLEPYAYWPLDRKMVSRRAEHRVAARKGMASVVKMTKKLEGKSASSALSMKFMKFKRTQKKHRNGKSR